MAIITRCRMPPDSWKGYHRTRSSGEGIPTERRSSTAVASASLRSRSRWSRSDSVIWRPIRFTGLRAVIGSWKIMLIWAPQTWRSWAGASVVISWSANRTVPLRTTSRTGSRPMMDRERTVFPEPDSPTMPRVSPRSTVNETPSTAWTVPRPVRKAVWRSSTTSRGPVSVVDVREGQGGGGGPAAGGRAHSSPSRMSNRCRRRSPIRLMESSIRNIARVGQIRM